MNKAEQIFNYVVAYQLAEKGLGPTLGDISCDLNIPKATVNDCVRKLEKAGRIERVPRKSGGIRAVGGQWIWHASVVQSE